MPRAAPHPDVYASDEDFVDADVVAWQFTLTDEKTGLVLDLSASALTAIVEDNGLQIGPLLMTRDEDSQGIVKLVLQKVLYDKLGTYSRWVLREGTRLNYNIVEGRILKNR